MAGRVTLQKASAKSICAGVVKFGKRETTVAEALGPFIAEELVWRLTCDEYSRLTQAPGTVAAAFSNAIVTTMAERVAHCLPLRAQEDWEPYVVNCSSSRIYLSFNF